MAHALYKLHTSVIFRLVYNSLVDISLIRVWYLYQMDIYLSGLFDIAFKKKKQNTPKKQVQM